MHKIERIAHFRTENRDFFLSRFFPFFLCVVRTFIISSGYSSSSKSKGFYAVGCTFSASPFSAGEPSSPVNPPRPFLPACNIAQSPYRFLCACVLLLSIFHPFPHVFLMCSRTHIVLILPLSHPVCVCVVLEQGRGWRTVQEGAPPFYFSFDLHLLPYIMCVGEGEEEGGGWHKKLVFTSVLHI